MNDVDSYLAQVPEEYCKVLKQVRKIIAKTVPEATEGISYGMPVFKYKGKYLVGYAAFKNHISIFPGGEITHMLSDALKDYKTAKGTIQFTLEHPLPTDLLEKIVRLRIHMIDETLAR